MKKKILITGAAGFIGSKLFSILKKNYEVTGIDFNILRSLDKNIYEIDILEKKKFSDLIKEKNPDFVFHLAAFAGPERNQKNPEYAFKYNVNIMKELLKILPKTTPIFFSSTDKVYSGQSKPSELINLTRPDSYHGELKLECEKILTSHTEKFFIFRQSVVHGEGGYKPLSRMASNGSFVDIAIDKLLNGNKVDAYSNVMRCFIKVNQLISVYSQLIESRNYGIFNIGSKVTSYFDRIKTICDNKKIATKDLFTPTQGNVSPTVQDMDTRKLETTFNVEMQ